MRGYVLITGAAGGLGKTFAAECASRGWDLFLTDISEPSLLALTKGMERLYGVSARGYACDLTDPQARLGLWQHIAKLGLRFHCLINVAGLDYQGLFQERRVDELHTILRLNIEATVEMTRRILQFRDPTVDLRIITVSSLAAFFPMPVKAVYAASKRFLLDWSLALGQELRSSGVTVTVLCPAGMRTTPVNIRAIEAQGLMGQITTLDIGFIAKRTLDHALAGRSIYIPGVVNQVLRVLGMLVPPSLVASAVGRRWEKTHRLSHNSLALSIPLHLESISQG